MMSACFPDVDEMAPNIVSTLNRVVPTGAQILPPSPMTDNNLAFARLLSLNSYAVGRPGDQSRCWNGSEGSHVAMARFMGIRHREGP